MAEMNKIQSFKTFSQIKEEEKNQQLQEEAKSKREQLATKISETLAELDVTSLTELSEEQRKQLVAKLFNEESEVEITTKGDVELEINQEEEEEEKDSESTDKKEVEEGNAFIYAAAKAKQDGKDNFEFNGKTYEVKLKADTGLKESYQLLITEATRWQFGIIDKRGNIESSYVHYDGYPDSVIPQIQDMNAKEVKKILKKSERGGMSSLTDYYNDADKSTLATGDVKNIRKYLKEVADDAGAEYVYLYDERDGQWKGADVFTDRALKPVEQLDEATIYEAEGDFAGWIAFYNRKKLEIDKSEAKDLWDAKQLAIKHFKVPKSKQGLLAIKPAVEESVITEAEIKPGQKVILIGQEGNEKTKWHGEFGIITKDGKSVKLDKTGNTFQLGDKWRATPVRESVVNEAKGFKNTEDFEAFLKEIDSMPESAIKKIMGKDYIDTPGFYEDEKDDYEDVIDFMMSNMGREDFQKLKNWWENNVQESVITEAEVKSDEEFAEYAMTVLKKAFGEDFDEAKAQEVINGLTSKYSGDYGAMVGALQSSLD